jgi:hypothetical protein
VQAVGAIDPGGVVVLRDFLRVHMPDELRRLQLEAVYGFLSARQFIQHRSSDEAWRGERTTQQTSTGIAVQVVENAPDGARAGADPRKYGLGLTR